MEEGKVETRIQMPWLVSRNTGEMTNEMPQRALNPHAADSSWEIEQST